MRYRHGWGRGLFTTWLEDCPQHFHAIKPWLSIFFISTHFFKLIWLCCWHLLEKHSSVFITASLYSFRKLFRHVFKNEKQNPEIFKIATYFYHFRGQSDINIQKNFFWTFFPPHLCIRREFVFQKHVAKILQSSFQHVNVLFCRNVKGWNRNYINYVEYFFVFSKICPWLKHFVYKFVYPLWGKKGAKSFPIFWGTSNVELSESKDENQFFQSRLKKFSRLKG